MLDVLLANQCVFLKQIHKHMQADCQSSKPNVLQLSARCTQSPRFTLHDIHVVILCPSDHRYIDLQLTPYESQKPRTDTQLADRKHPVEEIYDWCLYKQRNKWNQSKLIRNGSSIHRRLGKHKEYVRGLTRMQQHPLITTAACHTVDKLLVYVQCLPWAVDEQQWLSLGRDTQCFTGVENIHWVLAGDGSEAFSFSACCLQTAKHTKHIQTENKKNPSPWMFWSSEGWFHCKINILMHLNDWPKVYTQFITVGTYS